MKKETLIFIAIAAIGCGTANTPTAEEPTSTLGQTSQNAGSSADQRNSWQDPAVLMQYMGELNGKTVVDLFADDDHFVKAFVERGARVIAISTDQKKLDVIEAMKKEKGYSDAQLSTRITSAGEPGLGMAEADIALVINKYGALADRSKFFTKAKSGIKHGGQLVILDWLPRQTPIGPPMEMRVNEVQVMDELEPAGFTDIAARTDLFPYHFLILAQDFIPGPE